MADTIRTRATLLASFFQDGQTAGISANDMRDLIVSMKGVYGALSLDNASGIANTTIGTSFVLCDVFDTDVGDALTGIDANSAATYDLDVRTGSDGLFLVGVSMSFGGTGSTQFTGKIHKAGIETGIGFTRLLGAGGDIGTAAGLGLLTLAAGNTVTLHLKADGASKTLTAYQAFMGIIRVA